MIFYKSVTSYYVFDLIIFDENFINKIILKQNILKVLLSIVKIHTRPKVPCATCLQLILVCFYKLKKHTTRKIIAKYCLNVFVSAIDHTWHVQTNLCVILRMCV